MDEILLGDGMELDGTSLGAFVHTTHKALEEVFRHCGVDSKSCVIDIGCGDGRAAVVAAERFRCHAVGGIDVGVELIDKFDKKSRESLARMRASEGDPSTLPKVFCVAGDGLFWGKQNRLFLSAEELATVEPGSVVTTSDVVGVSKRSDVFLPEPTHIYLYILQHKLKYLVPLLKRIRHEVPNVVIISAFEFETRGAEESGSLEEGTDYLDVPVAETFLESKGRILFRVYK